VEFVGAVVQLIAVKNLNLLARTPFVGDLLTFGIDARLDKPVVP
jgi:hypothetical protein